MSRIDQLIKELCPNGVPYKELNEIGSFYSGLTGKSKEDFLNGNAKFISYMNVFGNIALNTDISESVKINEGEKQNLVQLGDILFTGSSETPNECGMSSVLTKEPSENLYLNSFCFGFRLNDKKLFLPDFSKYLFRSVFLRKQIIKTASGVTRFNVSKQKMQKVRVPVPPLPVQEEIVRILDAFTELKAELEAELEARKKQYEHYMEELLTNNEFEEKTLIDMLAQPITDGPHETPKFQSSGIPFISVEAIFENKIDINKKRGFISEDYHRQCCKKYRPQKNDVFMVKSGSTTGKVAIVDIENEFNVWSPIAAMRVNEQNSARYLFYLLQTKSIQSQVKRMCSKGSQPNLSMRILEKFKVRVPNLEVQERIVVSLDKLFNITHSLSNGLPAEIEARRKQYEYYRDKLLTFKELEV